MNDDYLWDRTGEPDPEIQQLEEVLGTLRYQPQPLELPVGIRPERKRSYFALLAIAAAIALLILATGLWIRIQQVKTHGQGELAVQPPATGEKQIMPVNIPSPTPGSTEQQVAGAEQERSPKEQINPRRRKPVVHGDSLAANAKRKRNPNVAATQDEVSVAQLEEARAAKDQLMLALRLASAKLNFAQRKTQGPPTPGTIRNQHKVG